jgi:hypothetical protein
VLSAIEGEEQLVGRRDELAVAERVVRSQHGTPQNFARDFLPLFLRERVERVEKATGGAGHEGKKWSGVSACQQSYPHASTIGYLTRRHTCLDQKCREQ